MALIGRIGEFNVDNEAVTAYLERLGLCLAANQVEDERKVAVFLSVVGSRTYGLLRSLFALTHEGIGAEWGRRGG